MRITCLIDNLASGGSQRQLCALAVLLRKRGADVTVVAYHPQDFFLPLLTEAGVRYRCVTARGRVQRVRAFRELLRRGRQDVVLAFLANPCILAELAALPRREWGLVVSERTSYLGAPRRTFLARTLLHRAADHVTTNSHTNRLLIERNAPWLRERVTTLYNCVDLAQFSPADGDRNDSGALRFLIVGRFSGEKNPLRLVEGFARAGEVLGDLPFRVDWYGDKAADSTSGHGLSTIYDTTLARIRELALEDRFRLHSPTPDIVDHYRRADAVVLASLYEGLPNTVCEGMACGRPILMSDVCDSGNLAVDGRNGMTFDPLSADDIARTVVRFCRSSTEARRLMGLASRELAERAFGAEPFLDGYTRILEAAARRQRITPQHWVPEVPASALISAGLPVGSLAGDRVGRGGGSPAPA